MKCAKCDSPTAGKSKYCQAHRAAARTAWKKMIQDKAKERDARDAGFTEIFQQAIIQGEAAGAAIVPEPMTVIGTENPLDDNARVVAKYHVPEGVCGFAWVKVTPGNCPFANWLKKNDLARKSYNGGVDIWVSYGGQSYERKTAYARAMADTLKQFGINCYASGRLD